MSQKSWKKEFYPPLNKVKKKDAAKHSLQKWIGLRKENLERHNLDEPPISVSASTCALCEFYYDDKCESCPLFKIRRNVACFDTDEIMESLNPFDEYDCNKNPEPMIKWLKKIK